MKKSVWNLWLCYKSLFRILLTRQNLASLAIWWKKPCKDMGLNEILTLDNNVGCNVRTRDQPWWSYRRVSVNLVWNVVTTGTMAGPLRYDQIDHIPAHLLDKLPRKYQNLSIVLSWNYNFVKFCCVFYPNIGIETKGKTFCSFFKNCLWCTSLARCWRLLLYLKFKFTFCFRWTRGALTDCLILRWKTGWWDQWGSR